MPSESNCSICNASPTFPVTNSRCNLISNYCQRCYDNRECKELKRIETHCGRCNKCDIVFKRVLGTMTFYVCWICNEKYEQGF